ncbi:MAG: hypothetical protein WCA81_02285 [Rhizomicrobium sp.]
MGQHWRHPPTAAPARSVHSPFFEFLNLLQSVFRSGDAMNDWLSFSPGPSSVKPTFGRKPTEPES